MSSPSPKPYKSRLFNFINRQYIRVNDRWEKTLRTAKIALEWGAQILIYPIYLLVQTGRLAFRQVQQKWERLQLPETHLEEDSGTSLLLTEESINQILEVVEPNLSLTDVFNSPATIQVAETSHPDFNQESINWESQEVNILPSRLIIQGIATSLENHNLVLVASDNQIIDCFNQPAQQQQLQKWIILKLAIYYYQRRLFELNKSLSSFDTENPHVLPPIRFFYQLMAWVETSPIALTINLFGESNHQKNLYLTAAFNSDDIALSFPSTGILNTLDASLATLENQDLDPNTLKQNLTESLALVKSKVKEIFPRFEELKTSVKNSPSYLQLVIEAAIDYFFSKKQSRVLRQSQSPNSDNLLTQNDRQSSTVKVISQQLSSTSNNLVLASQKYLLPSLNKWGEKISDRLYKLLQQNKIVAVSPQRNINTNEPEPFDLKILIQAALDRLFKERSKPKQLSSQLSQIFTEKPKLEIDDQGTFTDKIESDPWLSWEDIFGKNQNIYEEDIEDKSTTRKAILPSSPPLPNIGKKATQKKIKQQLNKQQKSVSIQTSQPKKKDLGKVSKSNKSLTQTNSTSNAITQENINNHQTNPEWIDTKATRTGYVKHPLERILEWLDQAIMFMEELVVSIWRCLKEKLK